MTLISQLCVLQLLREIENCSPDYIAEKWEYLKDEQYAFGMLDFGNQLAVVNYLSMWHQTKPMWMIRWLDEMERIR